MAFRGPFSTANLRRRHVDDSLQLRLPLAQNWIRNQSSVLLQTVFVLGTKQKKMP